MKKEKIVSKNKKQYLDGEFKIGMVFKTQHNDTFEILKLYPLSCRCKLINGNPTTTKNFDDTYTIHFYKHKFYKP